MEGVLCLSPLLTPRGDFHVNPHQLCSPLPSSASLSHFYIIEEKKNKLKVGMSGSQVCIACACKRCPLIYTLLMVLPGCELVLR